MTATLTFTRLRLPMRARMKHASFERTAGDSILVRAEQESHVGVGEGAPRHYVTGEHTERSLHWLHEHAAALSTLDSLEALAAFRITHAAAVQAHPAAWCAVEMALLDLMARQRACSVEALLGVPLEPGTFRYTAVVGDESGDTLHKLLARYLGAGFCDFKFKLSGDAAADLHKLVVFKQLSAEHAGPFTARLDGNNVFGTDVERARRVLETLCAGPVAVRAVEEPLAVGQPRELAGLSAHLGVPIILDESLQRPQDVAAHAEHGKGWVANLKVSRCGGLVRALALLETARQAGWPVLVGAQVGETSVLTRAAWVLVRAAGGHLWGLEGGFGTLLLERDVVEPVLMFGAQGVLEAASCGLAPVGLGLTCTAPQGDTP